MSARARASFAVLLRSTRSPGRPSGAPLAVLLFLAMAAPAAALPEGVAPADAPRIPSPPPAALRGAADSTIAAMAAAVDADSIHAFLERLTGVVPVSLDSGPQLLLTRYSPGPGAESAAEYLRDVFEGFGYQVTPHYFSFPYALPAIVTDGGGGGLAVGANGRVLRSADGTWWDESREGVESYDGTYYDVESVTGDDYVAVGTLGMIATTSDGGLSWTPRTSSATLRLSAADILPSGEGWIVGRDGVVLRTTDAGATWADQSSGVTALLYDVAAIDGATAVAVGAAGTILRTTDAGLTWVASPSGTTRDLLRTSFAGVLGWAVGGNGVILATSDAGATWEVRSSGTTWTLNGVSFADAGHGWAVGVQGTIVRTTDGGDTWAPQPSPLGTLTLLGVHAVDAGQAWITGLAGSLLRTSDAGATWEVRSSTVRDGWESVVAVLPGTTHPGEEMLLVGHYDSISQSSETVAPGADDNGSGIAAIVEAARRLAGARYHRTLKFICFSGEEQGLVGSHAYAGRALAQGEDIVGVFNLDCVGWNDDYFRIFSNGTSAWLGDVAATMAATHAPGLPTYHWFCDTCNWSDHYPFQTRGFAAICGIETWDPAPPQHHRTADTVALLDMALIADVTRIAIGTVATVAQVDTTAAVGAPGIAAADPAGLLVTPSPFGDRTTISYSLPGTAPARLSIHDVSGRLVATWGIGSPASADRSIVWNGRDARGAAVANGVYFVRLERPGEVHTRKLVRLR